MTDMLTTARAEALFTSAVHTGTRLSRDEVTAAVRQAVRRNRGVRGCVSAMAFAFGDRPELAAVRMRWARQVIRDAYTPTMAPG